MVSALRTVETGMIKLQSPAAAPRSRIERWPGRGRGADWGKPRRASRGRGRRRRAAGQLGEHPIVDRATRRGVGDGQEHATLVNHLESLQTVDAERGRRELDAVEHLDPDL